MPTGASPLFLSSERLYGCQSHLDFLSGTGFDEFRPLVIISHSPYPLIGTYVRLSVEPVGAKILSATSRCAYFLASRSRVAQR